MRVVVVGGTGLVGHQVVALLRDRGHEVVVAAPGTGVDAVTGAGLDAALAGADVVVDVANARTLDDAGVLAFFTAATRRLLAAGRAAGVRHHVVLSVVGADRLDAGYLRAKLAQEELVRAAGSGWTVVRATQFHEFVPVLLDALTDGDVVRVPPADLQTVASADVARVVADVAVGPALDGVLEVAGPERRACADVARAVLAAHGDPRVVEVDASATYFGAVPDRDALVPRGAARLGTVTLAEVHRA